MRRVLIPLTLAAVIAAIPANAAQAATKYPVVKGFSPSKVAIGEKITIRGKNFVRGKRKNTVVWLARNGPAVFTRADRATTTRITMVVPQKLASYLKVKSGAPIATRFRIRVLGKRFGRAYTSTKSSPIVVPSGQGGASSPDCDKDGVSNADETDDDDDLISDTVEKQIGLDGCLADTDGDGIEDGFEQISALDLNGKALPYPGKRPFPNALDPGDAGIDHDGDGMYLVDEYNAWKRYGKHELPLNYSAGKQYSASGTYGVGVRDDKADVDADGLQNWDEAHGPMLQDWWDQTMKNLPAPSCTDKEKRYTVTFPSVEWLDPDTDGDGVLDGSDDQDHDGLTNAQEVHRPIDWLYTYVSACRTPDLVAGGTNPFTLVGGIAQSAIPNLLARTQPYNPCKPVDSPTCHRHFPFDYYEDDPDWMPLNWAQ